MHSAIVVHIAGCHFVLKLQCACAVVSEYIKAIRKLQFETIFDHEVAGVATTFETETVFRVALEASQIIAAYVLVSNGEEFMIWFTLSAMLT